VLYPDYTETGYVYHVAPITDLDKILKKGIKYDDKNTYLSKYLEFHKYIDSFKPDYIPDWVIREKAVFSSMNFHNNHCWHSHTVIMTVKINPDKCWIANENLANKLYEPFILKDTIGFECAYDYLKLNGESTLRDYWDTSVSFNDNLEIRKDKEAGYDAEVLIFHDISPEDIKPLFIVSDHHIMSIEQWNDFFSRGTKNGNR